MRALNTTGMSQSTAYSGIASRAANPQAATGKGKKGKGKGKEGKGKDGKGKKDGKKGQKDGKAKGSYKDSYPGRAYWDTTRDISTQWDDESWKDESWKTQ